MTFDEYQKSAIETDLFNKKNDGGQLLSLAFMAKVLGISGEAGEFSDKVKKILRDKGGKMSDTDKQELGKELGDILWYISAVSHYLDLPLESIAAKNLDKVHGRKKRGVSRGSGDNR